MFAIAGNRSGITVRISKRLDWTGRANQSVENGFISSHRGKETNNFSSLITMHRVVTLVSHLSLWNILFSFSTSCCCLNRIFGRDE